MGRLPSEMTRREGNACLGTLTGQGAGLAGGLDVECEEKEDSQALLTG